MDKIKKVTIKNTDPDERIKNLELLITDYGYAKVRIFATIAETFHQPVETTKMKDSLCVNFYDEKGKVETILTSKYGEYYPDEGKIKIRNKVVLTNVNLKQIMETEELIWNQKDSTIYTERLVTVTSPKGKFYGDGIRSKQDFTNYEFIRPRGKISQD